MNATTSTIVPQPARPAFREVFDTSLASQAMRGAGMVLSR